VPEATRCGIQVQDAQDAQDAESTLRESGHKTTESDVGWLFAAEWHRPGRLNTGCGLKPTREVIRKLSISGNLTTNARGAE